MDSSPQDAPGALKRRRGGCATVASFEVKAYREYYFGAIDENRIAFGTGRDIVLNPKQKAGRLNYFMYPYAEIDGKPLDFLSQETLKYEVTFKEF
jgi:hypothetical protein